MEFTPNALSEFDGRNDGAIYISVRGEVFDVTPGRSFYGPGGPYAVFAGKECARALAFMKVDAEHCSASLEGATDKQLQTLQGWVDKFREKYAVVGRLLGEPAGE